MGEGRKGAEEDRAKKTCNLNITSPIFSPTMKHTLKKC